MNNLLSLLSLCGLINAFSQSISSYGDIVWVVGINLESHLAACTRKKLVPITQLINLFAWNETFVREVVSSQLNMSILNDQSVIDGCCAPSLWCRPEGCFTQSLGSNFVNYGWLPLDIISAPVYTCISASEYPIVLKNPIVKNQFQPANGVVAIGAQYIGDINQAITLTIDGTNCNDVEVCNKDTCVSCSQNRPCPIGSQCYSVGAFSYCYLLCSGPSDSSCPCSTSCQAIRLAVSFQLVYVCTPYNLLSGRDVCAMAYPNHYTYINFNTNLLKQQQYSTSKPSNYSIMVPSESNQHNGPNVGNQYIHITFTGTSCQSDSDCNDRNICTVDRCSSGYCIYSQLDDSNCSSILPAIQNQVAPYTYRTYLYSNCENEQSAFLSLMNTFGINADVYTSYKFNFWIEYFGNKVHQFAISPNGAVTLTPFSSCDIIAQCSIFFTNANVLSPWYSLNWIPIGKHGTGAPSVLYYNQIKVANQNSLTQSQFFFKNENAIHILFLDMVYKTTSKNSSIANESTHTFSVSIYDDSSILFNFINITSIDGIIPYPDLVGLWGSFQSNYSRYHVENISDVQYLPLSQSKSIVSTGAQAAFCPLNTTACVQEACLAPGQYLNLYWNGTYNCKSLLPYLIGYQCNWGGLIATRAILSSQPGGRTILSCPVPKMNIDNGTLINVDIDIYTFLEDAAGNSSRMFESEQYINDVPGAKSIFTVTQITKKLQTSDYLQRSNVMVRYYTYPFTFGSCGCSALMGYGGKTCDILGVCGGTNDLTHEADCAGQLFGNAYTDSCSNCAGGYTGNAPTSDCYYGLSSNDNISLISQTIILLMVICCMTIVTSTVSFSIRRLLMARNQRNNENDIDDLQILETGFAATGPSGRQGLTEFERDALGQVVFSKEIYLAHKKEVLMQSNSPALSNDKVDSHPEVVNTSSYDLQLEVNPSDDQVVYHDETKLESKEENLSIKSNPPVSTGMCDCPICLMDIGEGNICRILPPPCNHIFHLSCIDEWFKQSAFCPLCKRSLRAILLGQDEAPAATVTQPQQVYRPPFQPLFNIHMSRLTERRREFRNRDNNVNITPTGSITTSNSSSNQLEISSNQSAILPTSRNSVQPTAQRSLIGNQSDSENAATPIHNTINPDFVIEDNDSPNSHDALQGTSNNISQSFIRLLSRNDFNNATTSTNTHSSNSHSMYGYSPVLNSDVEGLELTQNHRTSHLSHTLIHRSEIQSGDNELGFIDLENSQME